MPVREEYIYKDNVWVDDEDGGRRRSVIIKPVSKWMKDMTYEEKEKVLNKWWSNFFISAFEKTPSWSLQDVIEAPMEPLGGFFGIGAGAYGIALDELLDEKNGQYQYREFYKFATKAFRLNTDNYRQICIEVYDTASDSIKQALRTLPVDYAEQQDDKTIYMIWVTNCFDVSGIEWIFKDVDEISAEDGSYKVLCKNRWVLFTMNMLPDDQWVKLDRKNEKHVKRIEKFLHVITETGVVTRTPRRSNRWMIR